MTSKLLFGYDRLSGNRPFPSPSLPTFPKLLFLALLRGRRETGMNGCWFLTELKAGIITSVAERACPIWYECKKNPKTTVLCWPMVVIAFHLTLNVFHI